MKLLTDEEYLKLQLALCLLRKDYATCMARITDFTEYGSVSFWLKDADYWNNKADALKLELDRIHQRVQLFNQKKESKNG